MADGVNLDDVMALEERDPGGMLAAIESFSKQAAEALRLGRDALDLPSSEGLKNIAFVGMGGSAIGGDILRTLLEDAVGMPITVHRSYRLPSLLGPDTLAVFVSYSGNTEETLSALEDAVYLRCRIFAITTGGELLERARGHRFPYTVVPGGLQPRAALAYLSLPATVVLEKMGLLQGFARVAHETVDFLQAKREDWGRLTPLARNFAKQLATRLHGKIPVIYGTEGILSVAAYRWKCQFNENSKNPAFCHTLPEMNHNEIVGWHVQDDFSRRVEVIMLVEEDDASRVAKRVEVTADILQDKVGGVTVIHVGGRTRTEKLFSAIHLGDFVSGYLALLNGVDPTPVESIALLKERMAQE
ncbi:MAG: bifunctional phosphoglucose/phosphomannose isomerase [Actinobacteria bacterium]|nr:bifunctional phosphoglucose/phosphomannose isomerase [Actinomycetota bacterium]